MTFFPSYFYQPDLSGVHIPAGRDVCLHVSLCSYRGVWERICTWMWVHSYISMCMSACVCECVHVWVCMCVSGYMLPEIKRVSVSWLAHSHCFLSVGCFSGNMDVQLQSPISTFTDFRISVCPWDAGETWFSPKSGNKVDFHLRRLVFYYCCAFLSCFHIHHIHCVSMKLWAWVRVTDRQKNNLRGAYSGSQHIDTT